jgi:hypothetical protein
MNGGIVRITSVPAVASAVLLGAAALGAWWWRAVAFRGAREEVVSESWQRFKEEWPLPEPSPEPPAISVETIDIAVRANPFSPQRRRVQAASSGTGEAAEPPIERIAPHFVYKGRINLGQRQRAVLEETTTQKTHFVETGQTVAGFKVLDITEDQVVLSDLQTREDVLVPLVSSAASNAKP